MTDIEKKAMSLVNDCGGDVLVVVRNGNPWVEALCRAIEQREAYEQKVSDAVGDTLFMLETHCDAEALVLASNRLLHLVIPKPKPKPDPLVEATLRVFPGNPFAKEHSERMRAALDALGFEITEKKNAE